MRVKIRAEDDGSASVRVGTSCAGVGVTITGGDGLGDRPARITSARPARRIGRPRAIGHDGAIRPAMEAAAIHAVLVGNDATRLGRALPAAHRAKDAVRRGRDPSEEGGGR